MIVIPCRLSLPVLFFLWLCGSNLHGPLAVEVPCQHRENSSQPKRTSKFPKHQNQWSNYTYCLGADVSRMLLSSLVIVLGMWEWPSRRFTCTQTSTSWMHRSGLGGNNSAPTSVCDMGSTLLAGSSIILRHLGRLRAYCRTSGCVRA